MSEERSNAHTGAQMTNSAKVLRMARMTTYLLGLQRIMKAKFITALVAASAGGRRFIIFTHKQMAPEVRVS